MQAFHANTPVFVSFHLMANLMTTYLYGKRLAKGNVIRRVRTRRCRQIIWCNLL